MRDLKEIGAQIHEAEATASDIEGDGVLAECTFSQTKKMLLAQVEELEDCLRKDESQIDKIMRDYEREFVKDTLIYTQDAQEMYIRLNALRWALGISTEIVNIEI